MQGGIHYDNFMVSTDVEKAKVFTAQTFDLRIAIEEKQNPAASSGGMFDSVKDFVIKNPIPIAITVVFLMLGTAFLCLRGGSTPPPPPKKKQTAKKDEDTTEEKTTEKTDDKQETDDKASTDKKGEVKGKKKDDAKGKKKDDKQSEGGVGLD